MRWFVPVMMLIAACEKAGVPPEPVPRATPEDAVRAFLAAVDDQDLERIGACFSQQSREGEFQSLVDGSASREEVADLARMFRGATILTTEVREEEGAASVRVALPNDPRGKETLSMVREGDAWKVRGF